MKILIFLLLFSFDSFSKNIISGVLLEKGTKKKLKGVNIYILPFKLKTTTNEQGRFEFKDIPSGEFEIIVNNPGHIRLKKTETTLKKNYTLYLEKEFYDVFETTVTAIKDKKDVTKKVLTQKDFISAPGAQEDPLKAVQNLPGIANQAASAQVVIQGSEPDDTRYTLNGHEIPIVFHFGGLSSIVMPQVVDSVEYLSSGYGPEYGRALGGIINLKTRRPKNDRWHAMGFVDIYNAGGLVEGAIDESSSIFFSSRYSYIGQILEKIAQDKEEFNLTVAPTFSDNFLSYNKQFSPTDELDILFVNSKDEIKFVVKEPFGNDPILRGDFYQQTNFFRVIPRWTKKIDDNKSIDFSLGYGDNDITFEVGDNFFKLDTTTFSQRFEFKNRLSSNYTYFFGVDSQQVKYNVQLKLPQRNNDTGVRGEVRLLDVEGSNDEVGLYLRNQFSFLADKLIVSPNIRYASFNTTDESYLMPRLSSTFDYDNSLSFKFATGLYYQAPQNGEAVAGSGNPELNSERAMHYNLGFEKDFRKGSSNGHVLCVDFFYKYLDQLIVETSKVAADGTAKVNSNDGTGTILGIQSLWKYRLNEINLVMAYTYLKSNRKEPGKKEYPSDFDQTHNLNIIASYEKSRWTYSTRLRYVTGRPYTPVVSAIFDSDNDLYVPVNGEFFSQRFDSFFQLDLRFDRKWIYDTWILSAYLDIQNITNNQNVQNISYNFDYSKEVKTAGLPILPIFGIKGEF